MELLTHVLEKLRPLYRGHEPDLPVAKPVLSPTFGDTGEVGASSNSNSN